jgi:hypothetical protein
MRSFAFTPAMLIHGMLLMHKVVLALSPLRHFFGVTSSDEVHEVFMSVCTLKTVKKYTDSVTITARSPELDL